MQTLGDKLFTCTALANDKDRTLNRCQARDFIQNGVKRWGFPN
jgi:hypothetical protein